MIGMMLVLTTINIVNSTIYTKVVTEDPGAIVNKKKYTIMIYTIFTCSVAVIILQLMVVFIFIFTVVKVWMLLSTHRNFRKNETSMILKIIVQLLQILAMIFTVLSTA